MAVKGSVNYAKPNLRLVHGLLPTLAVLGNRRAHSGRGIPPASDVAAHLPDAANQAWRRVGFEDGYKGKGSVRGLAVQFGNSAVALPTVSSACFVVT